MNPHLLDVLRRLSHEEFLSGQDIARSLGLSRASVHNAVRDAEQHGLRLQAVRGRGYRLPRPVDWLDPAPLRALGFHPHLLDCVDSSNAQLLREAQAGAPHKSLLAAEWQEKGRGRRGRSWLGGLGGGLTFSLLWRFQRSTGELSGLSLAVGVALARSLHDQGLADAGLKWPNDVLVQGAKLAGVLIELSGEMSGPSAAVIGIGVNVAGAAELRAAVEQPVTDLSEHLPRPSRNRLLLDLAARLAELLERFDAEGFEPLRGEWERLHVHQNRRVTLLTGHGEPIRGEALGVDAQGALLLGVDGAIRRFHSGEVSLRGEA